MKILGLILLLVGHLAFAEEGDLTLEPDPLDTASSQPSSPIEAPPPMPIQETKSVSQPQPDEGTSTVEGLGIFGNYLRLGVGLSYSINNRAKFDPVEFSDGIIPEKTTAEFNYNNVIAFEIELRYLKPMTIGFIAGATIDQERKLTSGKFTGATQGNTFIVYVLNPDLNMNLKVSTYYINAGFRAEDFYFDGGINYCSVQMSSTTNVFGTMSAQGGLGWQAGMGYYVTPDIVLEILTRRVTIKMTATLDSIDGSSVDYGQGSFSNTFLTAKYLF